jgi:hypothetical protein
MYAHIVVVYIEMSHSRAFGGNFAVGGVIDIEVWGKVNVLTHPDTHWRFHPDPPKKKRPEINQSSNI